VRHLNDLFRLRDCPQSQEMVFADQQELFPIVRPAGCIRYEIGTCLGPCAAGCSEKDYAAQVRVARAFLEGRDTRALNQIEDRMAVASERLDFERAAALRDRLENLRWLADRLGFMRRARHKHTFIYTVTGHDETVIWYLIHQGQVRSAVAAPHDNSSRQQAAEQIEALYHKNGRARLWRNEEVDGLLLVAGWFRRYPEERSRCVSPTQAYAACCR
jgi:excinuclease ABC subunit C